MTAKSTRKPGTRSAEATQARILAAAKIEFAKNGLGGARVDIIAERSKVNKRMIYHYFNGKEGLFQTVLEDAYVDIRTAEQESQRFVRGVKSGDFRAGVDPVQLNITIAAIGCYYLTNRFTGSIVFGRDFMAPEALTERLDFNIETIMRLVRAD